MDLSTAKKAIPFLEKETHLQTAKATATPH